MEEILEMEKQIKQLIFSEEYKKLTTLEKSLNVFQLLGIQQNENIHSNIIAALLDRKKSPINSKSFFYDLLGAISLKNNNLWLRDITEIISCDFNVFREKYRIDILMEDWNKKIVIGIENKINAIERVEQISDYQEILREKYPSFRAYMLFLTPTGYESKTLNNLSNIPCFSISYQDIYEALKNQEESDTSKLTHWLRINIEKEIIMNSEENELVRNLWSDYETAKILRIITDNRPKLIDIKSQLIERIKKITNKEINVLEYPENRGETKEIKVFIKDWFEMGFKFTFMFYMYEARPAFRTLILSQDVVNEKVKLFMDFADENFDKNIPKLKNWTMWHKVFIEDDYPEESYLNDFGFNENTVNEFISRFEQSYSLINNVIEKIKMSNKE